MKIANLVALIILSIIGLNLLIVGIFSYNVLAQLLGEGLGVLTRMVYILAGLSAIWLIFSAIYNKGISFMSKAE